MSEHYPLPNSGRQPELDTARGLAVLFMVLVHTQEYFSTIATAQTLTGGIIDFLGGIPAAPVFMFILGIGLVYSRRTAPQFLIKRGVLLLGAGYLLNLLRGTIPSIIRWQLTGDNEFLPYALDQLIYVDIFQFSGLTMLLFGLLRKIKNLYSIHIMLFLSLCVIANFLILPNKTSHYILSAVTGLFWGSNECSFFPFLSWIFYPCAGYIFGTILIRCAAKKLLYIKACAVSIAATLFSVAVFYGLFQFDMGLSSEYSYYHHTLWANILFTAITVTWLSILFFLIPFIPVRILRHIERWSKNVTEIYFIHWLLIGVLVAFTGEQKLNLLEYYILFALLFSISDFIAHRYLLYKKEHGIT